jgi:hypothetical protein
MVIFTKKVEILEIRYDLMVSYFQTSRITYQTSYYLFGILFWRAKLIKNSPLKTSPRY